MRLGQKSCDRCGDRGTHFVTPYWDAKLGLCSQCCLEMNKLYDAEGWPAGAPSEDAEIEEGRKVLRPGPSLMSQPIAVERSA